MLKRTGLLRAGWDARRHGVAARLPTCRGRSPPTRSDPRGYVQVPVPQPKVAHFAPVLPQVTADFEKNWKHPISRALDDMRVWNNTRGGMWIRNQSLLA